MTTVDYVGSVPDHVDDKLVHDIDHYNIPGMHDKYCEEDIHQLWKNVQDTYPPVFWTPRYGGHWITTRYEHLQRVLTEHETFSSSELVIPTGVAPKFIPVQLDPPEHADYRKLLAPAFTPGKLNEVAANARAIAIEIIERVRPQGRCDFVADFASAMPIIAFLTMIDLPIEDADRLATMLRDADPAAPGAAEAWAQMAAYLSGHIEERRAEPRDDVISSLVQAEVNGQPLTPEEVLGMCLLLLAAGLDTTALMTAFAARYIAQDRSCREELAANPDLYGVAVEEFARRFGLSSIARLVRRDTQLGDATLREGDLILAVTSLGGLDETVNPDPMRLDFDRRRARHTTFGQGAHTCIGMRLAKLELNIFLEEWFSRIPDFWIADGPAPRMSSGLTLKLHELNLEWPTD
ncbi:cytochrome P450 (plasmid) [Rhodococcus sp. USK10]|uniref:cytochrome P450 n=1 Tax=Rhodococcus sp. USK10 TaxID=2789739 RepID=UPI001C5CE9D7|nr:cytochrome P450 [Rhodococcus sp. USK10]QYA99750.1 cytochrome P450 [Rhodococcus sp. USK10]